jgi:predicted PurR-regulated permease PerM
MNTSLKIPFFVKATILLIGFYLFISILSIGKHIILPIIYALIVAILISPVVAFLVKRRLNRALAILGVLVVALFIVAGLVALLSSQASHLSESWPTLTLKFQELLKQMVVWISGYFNISVNEINLWITNATSEVFNNSNVAIRKTLNKMGGIATTVMLTPVYIFMILYYQNHLVEFIHKLFGAGNDVKVSEILTATRTIIQSYLVGLFIEIVIVAVLNSVGLLILGIQYAVLLGIAGALLNVIPYLGGFIAMTIFSIIALITKSPVYVLYVIALYNIIQFIDNNILVPKIVGSKVKLNALISIVAVIAGAALWGIPGMFLCIPLTAIIKLIFDRIDSLKTWGFLLGDTMPPLIKLKLNLRKLTKKQ